MIIVHENAFGAAVAAALAARDASGRAMRLAEAMQHDWQAEAGNFVAIALGESHPTRLAALTETLWSQGIPHSAAILSDHLLACGPLVMPHAAPCLRCGMKRALSTAESPRTAKLDQNLQMYQERNPGRELRGHLPSLVQMAALKLMSHATLNPRYHGVVSAISFSNNRSLESRVIPLHACRCRGAAERSPGERWVHDLEQEIEGVLTS